MDEKLAQILKLTSKAELEAASSQLTLPQVHEILQLLSKENHDRLLPILVGLTEGTFYQLLSEITPQESDLLKEVGSSEALQHKLVVLARDWKEELYRLGSAIEQVKASIDKLDLQQVKKEEILSIKEGIDALDHTLEERLTILNNALTLAWNTKRIDLIDSLSDLKDQFRRLNALFIGRPKSQEHSASGLYKNLEERLNLVYSLKDSQKNLLLLSSEEPAIEALASLNIFYLEDYCDLGLLPTIHSLKELRQTLRAKTHEEKKILLEQLVEQAENRLNDLGLTNVNALKEAKIFSKEMLREYILNYKL